jgi:hypothetical protein
MLTLPGAIVLWLASAGGGDAPCGLCQDQGSIACSRCDAKGVRTVSCSRCGGDRKLVCPLQRCDEGRYVCPACDGGREILWESGSKDPCAYCSQKGSVRCPLCKGERRLGCPDCKGAGKRAVPCGACLGLKRLPCPHTRDAKPCPPCQGTRTLVCHQCGGAGGFDQRCKDCGDFGTKLCDCVGGRSVCKECHGAGRVRFVLEGNRSKAGTNKCSRCGARGFVKCTRCDGDGGKPCPTRPAKEDCKSCKDGKIDCPRCNK